MDPRQFKVYKGAGGRNGAIQFNLSDPHYFKEGTTPLEKSYNGKDRDGNSIFEVAEGRRRPKQGWKEREGAIFMEITSAKDKNVYDWENKVIMALSVSDIGKLLLTLATGNECRIVHDPNAKKEGQGITKKFLTVTSPDGTAKGVMFHVKMTSGGEERSHSVPLDGAEVMTLRCLLQAATTRALSW